MIKHAKALHRDQSLGARIGILDEKTGGVADLVILGLWNDGQAAVAAVVPHHIIFANSIGFQCGAVAIAFGVVDGGNNAVAAGFIRREAAGQRRFFRIALAGGGNIPIRMIFREIGVARALHPGRLGHFMFNLDVNRRSLCRLAVLINHHILHIRRLAHREQPVAVVQTHQPIDAHKIRMRLRGDEFAPVIGNGALHHQLAKHHFGSARVKHRTQFALVVDEVLCLENLLGVFFTLEAVKAEILDERIIRSELGGIQYGGDACGRIRIGAA